MRRHSIEGAIPLCAKGRGIRALSPFGVENESSVARIRAMPIVRLSITYVKTCQ